MIPIRTDRQQEHTPWVNYLLIAANVVVFLFFQRTRADLPGMRLYMLWPDRPELHQFFSCMFMHGGWLHLLGNMVFLWVFGNAVNDGFGHVGYLAFYLAGGVCAGIGYVLLSGHAPVLGASGAISAVTGAFLVLYPRVRVTVLVPLFYVLMPFEVSSLFFLLFQFIWNVLYSFNQADAGVAYVAHASGYVFGIGLVAALLYVRLLPRDVYDLLSLIRTWQRREAYRRAVSDGFDPFTYGSGGVGRPGQRGRWVRAQSTATEPAAGPAARELELRRRIAADHASGDFSSAAAGYLQLVQIGEHAVLPQTQQLDVSNYLMSTERYPAAADAYERFLEHYPRYEYAGDVRLMLGLIYSRYLQQADRAEEYLARALNELSDNTKLQLARKELEQLRHRH